MHTCVYPHTCIWTHTPTLLHMLLLMSENSRGSIYESTWNSHTKKNKNTPELGLVAVDWGRDGSLQLAAAFFGLIFFFLNYCCLFVFSYYL